MQQVNQAWCRAAMVVVMLITVGVMGTSRAQATPPEERLDIEEVMRAFNGRVNMMARYGKDQDSNGTYDQYDGQAVDSYYVNYWVSWPACAGGGAAPPKPKDLFYGPKEVLDDARYAVLVGAIVNAFYAGRSALGNQTLYSKFLNEQEPEVNGLPHFYELADFPKVWESVADEEVTTSNYEAAYEKISEYLASLNATALGGSATQVALPGPQLRMYTVNGIDWGTDFLGFPPVAQP